MQINFTHNRVEDRNRAFSPRRREAGAFELSSATNFRFSSSIQASIRCSRPLSIHSLRAFCSRSISDLMTATSLREIMVEVYAGVQKNQPRRELRPRS
jgi:hypothetical protein